MEYYLVIDLNLSVNSQEEGTKKIPGKIFIASDSYILMDKNVWVISVVKRILKYEHNKVL